MTNARRISIIAIIVLLALPVDGWFLHGDGINAVIGREGLFWASVALILAFVVRVERRPLSSIGLVRPSWWTLLYGLIGGVIMTAALALVYMVIFPALQLGSDLGTSSPMAALPIWLKVVIVVRAAIFEELFYRGFMIERIAEIIRLRWLAAFISWCAFTAAHLPAWGLSHLLVAGTGGAILTALYLWRRDLPANMLAHFLTDAIGFLL